MLRRRLLLPIAIIIVCGAAGFLIGGRLRGRTRVVEPQEPPGVLLGDGQRKPAVKVHATAVNLPWLQGDAAATSAWFASHRDDPATARELNPIACSGPDQQAMRERATALESVVADTAMPTPIRYEVASALIEWCGYDRPAAYRVPIDQLIRLCARRAELVRPHNRIAWMLDLRAALLGLAYPIHPDSPALGPAAVRAALAQDGCVLADALFAELSRDPRHRWPRSPQRDGALAALDRREPLADDEVLAIGFHGVLDQDIEAHADEVLARLRAAPTAVEATVAFHAALVLMRGRDLERGRLVELLGTLHRHFRPWAGKRSAVTVATVLRLSPVDLPNADVLALMRSLGWEIDDGEFSAVAAWHPRQGRDDWIADFGWDWWLDPWFALTRQQD